LSSNEFINNKLAAKVTRQLQGNIFPSLRIGKHCQIKKVISVVLLENLIVEACLVKRNKNHQLLSSE